MKILFFIKTSQNLSNFKKLGGIEILNYNLYNFFKLNNNNEIIFENKITNKVKNTNWDIVLSSNDARIFNIVNTKRKILWLHNKMQIEKSIRKKQFFSLIFNKIEAIFVSKYLEKNTSFIYNFNKRIVIPNFLSTDFIKITKKKFFRKKIFIWSVQRDRGLADVIDVWINKVIKKHPDAELHIFGVKNNSDYRTLRHHNIFNHGRVTRDVLISYYKKSMASICLGYDETFCLNAIEAMSCGLPIISLGKTAINELLINKINGFKISSINDLDQTISKIINLSFLKRIKLIKSTMQYSKKYHLKNIIKHWYKLFNYELFN